MNSYWEKIKPLAPWIIGALSAILIFTGLMRADIQHDDATYSFRSVAYLDFLNANEQTTPLQWFEEIPWWSYLSFHDHPPLVFLLQHIFFTIFGESTFVAKLPFALAGVGVVFLCMLLGRELYSERVGLLAGLVLVLSSYHVWGSRVGYLEGISSLFILLTIYLFLKAQKKPLLFWVFGLSLGLALLTKYTAVFFVPALFLFVLIKNRNLFLNKHFLGSLFLAALLLAPVLFYNFQLLDTRGHFDLQLSILFGQDISQDWPSITRGVGGGSLFSVAFILAEVMSPLLLLLVAGSLIYLFFDYIRFFKEQRNILLLSVAVFGVAIFTIVGAEPRFLIPLMPFLVIFLSICFWKLYDFIISKATNKSAYQVAIGIIFAVVLVMELFYNINTNIAYSASGEAGKYYSKHRWETGGFNELETFLINERFGDIPPIKKITKKEDILIRFDKLEGKNIFIYDQDLDWFSVLWYFSRPSVLHDITFLRADELAAVVSPENWGPEFTALGVGQMNFIAGESDVVLGAKDNRRWVNQLAAAFSLSGAIEEKIINKNNEHVFTVYTLTLNQ